MDKDYLPRPLWVSDFAEELVKQRPEYTYKFALVIGHAQWAAHPEKDPIKVAKQWGERPVN